MAIHYEDKKGKVTTLGGQDPKVKMPTEVRPPRTMNPKPVVRAIDIQNLEESRGKFVLQMRATPNVFGHSAWYRDEDWDAKGKLIATGEALLRALDPWANDRAQRRACPPLPKAEIMKLHPEAKIDHPLTSDIGQRPVTKTGGATNPSDRVSVTRVHRPGSKGGRPKKANSMTAAERMRKMRVRKNDR